MSIWDTLGVAETVAVADLRRRYATLIKEFRPETHPQDFARIRQAYEVALPWARRREAELAAQPVAVGGAGEPLPQSQVDPAPPDAPADAAAAAAGEPQSIEAQRLASEPAGTATPVDADAGAPDGQPRLATLFHRFHALAQAAAGTRDEAWLPELAALLQARSSASLDDSQALEFALMRWFIEAENPPLTLLFEAGRAFDWHLHPARLSSWLSPWALRRMEARLSLARDLVWARHFSGNACLRKLHSPAPAMTPLASRPATVEAMRWAERWRSGCASAEAPALAEALDARVLRRLQGQQLMSTDLLAGLTFALAADDLANAALYAVVGAVGSFALRLGLRWLHPEPGEFRLPRPIGRALSRHAGWAVLLAAGCAALGLALLALDETGGDSRAVALPLVAPAALMGMVAIWHVLAWLELVAAEPLSWRDAVDRLEFDATLRRHAAVDPASRFAPRLSTWQRWRAIPAALALRRTELATRARPPRPPVWRWIRFTLAKPSLARMIWIGLWVLFAILRGVHAFGH